jgi:hypothetical protein
MLFNKRTVNIFSNTVDFFSEVGRSCAGSHYPSAGLVEVSSHFDSMARVSFKRRHEKQVRKKCVTYFHQCIGN